MSPRRALAAALAAWLVAFGTLVPVRAARPLLEQHQWDSYFAMFARDVALPWQKATIRLDTYSGAPVDFAAFNVDPAEVIVAGANRAARPLDTAHRKAVVRWRYTPPPGYRFLSSDVDVPLGSQEGFYVVEARRGEAVQQVWLNRTHIGLLTHESPEGLLLWAVDLHSGRPLANMHVEFLVGLHLVVRSTAPDGTIAWDPKQPRPVFALAHDGAGRAFVSLLPSAPLPASLVGVRVESAVVRSGERIRLVGFARRRSDGRYRRGTGFVRLSVVGGGRTIAQAQARLDDAGAFVAEIPVPPTAAAGDYAVLAAAAGGVGGTSLRIDAASDLTLAVAAMGCPCEPAQPVPLELAASRAGVPAPGEDVRVQVVRSPHVAPPGSAEDSTRWGTTTVLDRHVRTGPDGSVQVTLKPPSDGLDSTYAVKASVRGATARARVVVPAGPVALAVTPDTTEADLGAPLGFDIRGFTVADGTPAANLPVRLRLTHGSTVREVSVHLDATGHARASVRDAPLGTNLVVADAALADAHVYDAAAVDVAPRALSGVSGTEATDLAIAADHSRYGPRDRVTLRASAPGASGVALFTLDGARTYAERVAGTGGGHAGASLDLGDAQGAVRATASFVRDGAIATVAMPLAIDGPGHARATALELDRPAYAPGSLAHVTVRDAGPHGASETGTLALRVSDARSFGGAAFEDAPDVLLTGGTTSQAPASASVSWHAWVAPTRSKASDLFATDRGRRVANEVPSLGVAAPHTLLWRVQNVAGKSFDLTVPALPGRYVLSVLKIAADGDVGASTASFEVQ